MKDYPGSDSVNMKFKKRQGLKAMGQIVILSGGDGLRRCAKAPFGVREIFCIRTGVVVI